MDDWHPIETIPYETPVLLTDGKVVVVGEFLEGRGCSPVGWWGLDAEWDFADDDLTHWMPCPKPPEGSHAT